MRYMLFILLASVCIMGCQEKKDKQPQDVSSAKPATDPEIIVAIGKVEPEAEIINLSAPVGGIIREVTKKNGDSVFRNEVLIRLDDDAEQLKREEIRTKIETQRTKIAIERSALKETELNLSNKKLLLDRTERLVGKGAETRQAYDDLLTEVSVLEANVEKGKTRIIMEENHLGELYSLLRTAENELGKKQFRAPMDGIILENMWSPGESVDIYATYAAFAPKGNLVVRAEVDELFAQGVKPGQSVEVVTTGTDNRITGGKVMSISPFLKKKSIFSEKTDEQEDRRVREVRISIQETGKLIINGRVECKIKTKP